MLKQQLQAVPRVLMTQACGQPRPLTGFPFPFCSLPAGATPQNGTAKASDTSVLQKLLELGTLSSLSLLRVQKQKSKLSQRDIKLREQEGKRILTVWRVHECEGMLQWEPEITEPVELVPSLPGDG